MSTPRWTLSSNGYEVLRDGERAFSIEPTPFLAHQSARPSSVATAALVRRIVSMLNATELSSDALARLQAVVMEHACWSKEESLEVNTLTDTLNHTVRMYVELDEEPSIALDEH